MLHSDSLGVENRSNNLNNRKPRLKNNCHFHLERNCIKTDFPLSKIVMRSLRIYATIDFIGRYYQGTQNHDHWQNICPPNNWNSLLCWAKALMAGWWVPILGLSLQGWLNLTHKARGFNEPLSLTDWKWGFCWRWKKWMDKFTLKSVSLCFFDDNYFICLLYTRHALGIIHWMFTIILRSLW